MSFTIVHGGCFLLTSAILLGWSPLSSDISTSTDKVFSVGRSKSLSYFFDWSVDLISNARIGNIVTNQYIVVRIATFNPQSLVSFFTEGRFQSLSTCAQADLNIRQGDLCKQRLHANFLITPQHDPVKLSVSIEVG